MLATTHTLGLSAAAAAAVGLPSGVPVVVGAGDGPLGNLATGAMTPGTVGLSLGTSGAARMVVPEPVLDPQGRAVLLRPHTRPMGSRWRCEQRRDRRPVAGGVFGDRLGGPGTAGTDAELLALADAVPPGCDGLVMLPYLLAERAPLWDPDLTGAYLGIRRGHTRGHFVRAAVEGVALQLSTIVASLDRMEPVMSVRAAGGALRSPLWRRVLAGVIGRPLTVTGDAEGVALGVAALGLFALGRVPDLHAAVEAVAPAALTGSALFAVSEVADAQEVTLYAGL